MLPALEKLLILQERDEKLQQLQDELVRMPLEEQALEKKWLGAQQRLEQLRGSLRQLEVERKKLDLDATSKREQIGRYKTQQLQTRKNEEFSALANEIGHAEKEIVAIEDGELQVMERISELDKQVAAEQAALKTQEADVTRQRGEFKIRRTKMEEEIARVKGLQAEAEKEITALEEGDVLLNRYRRIFASKKKQAVVGVSHGSCGGCHMKLTPQTLVAARGKEIAACENCGRLLFWNE